MHASHPCAVRPHTRACERPRKPLQTSELRWSFGRPGFWSPEQAFCLKFHQRKIKFQWVKGRNGEEGWKRPGWRRIPSPSAGDLLVGRRHPGLPWGRGAQRGRPCALSTRLRRMRFPGQFGERLERQCSAFPSSPFLNAAAQWRAGQERSRTGGGDFAQRSPLQVVTRGAILEGLRGGRAARVLPARPGLLHSLSERSPLLVPGLGPPPARDCCVGCWAPSGPKESINRLLLPFPDTRSPPDCCKEVKPGRKLGPGAAASGDPGAEGP